LRREIHSARGLAAPVCVGTLTALAESMTFGP
jgi:hypothetical protein